MAQGRWWQRLGVVVLALGLTACGSMSEEMCRTADWTQKGEEDGARGFDMLRLDELQQTCPKLGITPNATAWRTGWERGLAQYCSPRSGWQEGKIGSTYKGVCVGRDENAFLQAYNMGRAYYRIDQDINRAINEQRYLENLMLGARTEEERNNFRGRQRLLDMEIGRLRMQRDMLPMPSF